MHALSTVSLVGGSPGSFGSPGSSFGSPGDFPARAEALGYRAIALDPGVDAATLAALGPALLGARPIGPGAALEVAAVEAPCPRPPLTGGDRAPYLASDDRDERRAAAKDVEATVATAVQLGARIVILRLGVLDVKHDFGATVRAFAQRKLDDDALERIVLLRRSLSARALDLARFGLEPVLEFAAAAGVTIGLVNRPRWFEIPSAAEVATLLDELRGAPLAPFYDPAAAHVRAALGLGAGRPAVEVERACGAFLTDAAGLRGGLPWGTGEIDRAAVLAKLPAEAPRIVRSRIATDEELLGALAAIEPSRTSQPS
jgi:hypothetical protein